MINFKQIEMAGFKSFADKLDIKFEDGITCIVGPNGCGKSNVADAIRWVLGEQSTKLLRGSSMQDVIFNGTEKRKSLSYCEVSLIFDNTARNFDLNFDEVVMTRKLYRSGESEYLINRTPCRLKDIVNALHDSGIGRDGYSIIGQGKVDEIINAKPENRRAIFEEAAGIAKFKQRKIEAERKLLRTDENLTRVQDILTEVERQLTPLKKQSESAKKYLEFKEQLKHHEVNIYIYQYDRASVNKQAIQQKIDAINEEINIKQQTLDGLNKKYNANMEHIGGIDKTIDQLHNKILTLTVGIEKRTGEANVIKERMKFLTEEKQKQTEEYAKQKNILSGAEKSRAAKENELKAKKQQLALLTKQHDELEQEYLKIVDEVTANEQEQKEMIEALANFTDLKSNLSALKAQREAYSNNIADIDKKIQTLNTKIAEKQAEQKNVKEVAAKAVLNAKNLKISIEKLEKQQEQNEKLLNENIQAIMKNTSNMQIMADRKTVLTDMQKAYEGYAYSIKRLMQDSTKNNELKKKIAGLVSAAIKIPAGYEIAIEAALGGAVQNIITSTEQDSKDLINYLKKNDLGRATFLPISAMKPKSLEKGELKLLSGSARVASEIISFDKALKPVFESLLGRTVVVNTIDGAVVLAKKSGFAFKIVTMEGDVIYPQGSMSGGSKKANTANLLSRDTEIAEITKQIAGFEQKAKELEAKKEQLTKLTATAEKELETENALLVQAEVTAAREQQNLQQCNIYLEEHDKEKIAFNSEKTNLLNNIKVIEGAISKIDKSSGANIKKSNAGSISTGQQAFAELKTKRDMLHEKLTKTRISIAGLEGDISLLNSDLERFNDTIKQAEFIINNIALSLKNIDSSLGGGGTLRTNAGDKTNSEALEELNQVKVKMSEIEGTKQKLQTELKLIDDDRNNVTAEMNRTVDKRYQQEMALTKVDTDIETMQERIFEEYELTYAGCLEFKQPDYNLEEGSGIASNLKREIAKLGYVNVNAIEEYKLVSERHGGMLEQAEDLTAAKVDLLQIINELAAEMTARFDSEFKKVQENFSRVFKELFGGGNAKLELVENEDPLLAGVEIIAEPPGKKLQSITLLSGGEKALTAIAILFAILRLRPMPFCLLDEIEAALDDANVERFAKYLKRFSEETQFIVITHRKPTMELGDRLYGVTMEEKGVSKVVAVSLGEAAKSAV